MKTVLHLAATDLKRMRGWIAAWLALLVAPIAIAPFFTARLADEANLDDIQTAMKVAGLLQVLLGYLIVLVLMQGDPVIGTRQFWLTRPIARWRMLMAKVAAAVSILGGGVILVGLPWWLYCGFSAADLVRMSGEYLILALVVIVPAMLLSVLTDSLARAILWSFAFYAVLMVVLLPMTMMSTAPAGALGPLFAFQLLGVGAIWLFTAAAVVAVVFLTRRRRWAPLALPIAIVAPWGLVLLPPSWIQGKPKERAPERAAGIQLKFEEGWSQPARTAQRKPGVMRFDHLRVAFSATRPADELRVVGLGAEQTWRWNNTRLDRRDFVNTLEEMRPPGFRPAARDAVTEARAKEMRARVAPKMQPLERPSEGVWLQAYSPVPSSWAARMATEPSTYESRIWLALLRPEIAHEVRVRAGAEGAGGSIGTSIIDLQRGGEMTAIRLTQRRPSFWTKELAREVKAGRWYREALEPRPFLVNRQLNEYRHTSASRRHSLLIHGVDITGTILSVTAQRRWRNNGWAVVEPEGWLEGATLVYVAMRSEAVFARDVRVENFTIKRARED